MQKKTGEKWLPNSTINGLCNCLPVPPLLFFRAFLPAYFTIQSSGHPTRPADTAAQKLLGTIYKDVVNEASDTKRVHTKRMSLKKDFQSQVKRAGKRQQKGGKNWEIRTSGNGRTLVMGGGGCCFFFFLWWGGEDAEENLKLDYVYKMPEYVNNFAWWYLPS